jgi:hypothetical protein
MHTDVRNNAMRLVVLAGFALWLPVVAATELTPFQVRRVNYAPPAPVVRAAHPGVFQNRPMGIPVAAIIRQPDTPRSPVVQPVPLPPPAESIGPGGAMGPVNPPNYGDTGIVPIGALSINILPKEGQLPREVDPTKKLEQEFGATEFRREPLNYNYMWESPAFFNKPLYFEQPNLERYGYDWGLAQPWISGAQFFVKIPLLPYMMVVHPPHERVYSLGYYRPGSRAPYQINWPEVRLDAIVVEAAFITGLCFLIP